MISSLNLVHNSDIPNAKNHISTAYPSLQVENETVKDQNISYLSYGGFMGGWAAMSVASLESQSINIR